MKSYDLNHNLMHKFNHQAQVILLLIPIPGCDTLPLERCAPGWFVSTRSRLPFHSRESARWSLQQLAAREEILQELSPDLGESSYDNWDYQQHDALLTFMNQRMLAAPSEPRHIWKLDGPLEDGPADETPTAAWLNMAHAGPLPPIWDLLDCQPHVETLHLLNIEEFTDLVNGCTPDALLRNSFVILRMVATARYFHLKAQELHDAFISAHVTIGDDLEEKIRLRVHQASTSPSRGYLQRGARSDWPTSFVANSGWPSRTSFGPAMLTPQPWARPTRKRRTWTIN